MRIVLLTIFTLFELLSFAQLHYPPITNFSSQDYGRNQNPETWSVVQDNRGIMYFGTGNNILEYDGKTWNIIYVQQGSFIRALAVDSSGVVYVGVYEDFGFLSPDEKGQLEFVSLKEKLPEEDQFFGEIYYIYANEKSVFFQAQEAFFEYDTESGEIWTIYPEDSYHTCYMVRGDLYLRERGVGIIRYANDTPVRLEGTEIFEEYGVFGIHALDDDSLLIVTQELGLFKWANGNMRQLPELNETPLSSLQVYGSTELPDGKFALNTFTDGLIIIDAHGRIQKTISRNSGIRSNDVKDVFVDRDLNVWLALGNGIAKINYASPLSYYDAKSGVDGNVEAITRFKGELFVGTAFGLYKQHNDESSFKRFLNTEVVKGQVWDFEVVDDVLYVASSKGIYRSSDGVNFSHPIEVEGMNTIRFAPELKHFVVGGKNGVFVYDQNMNEVWKHNNNYSTFLGTEVDPADGNIIWLGTSRDGVLRLKYVDGDYILDVYGYFDGLPDAQLAKPIRIGDHLTFGTTQGLHSFITEDEMVMDLPDSLKRDPDYYRGMFESEMFEDSVFTGQILLLAQAEDRMWYCNEHEIGYYDLDLKEFVNKPFWGVDHGRINEFYLEENGVLWIGSADGLIRYQTNKLKSYDHTFYALIRSVELGRDSILFSGAFSDEHGHPVIEQPLTDIFEIEYRNNDIRFTFSAPFFEDDQDVSFSYMLEGQDEGWSPWSKKNEANFTNLHEGEYTFKVKAQNIFKHESIVAEYKFTILPPWYRTAWAYMTYGLGFILVFFIGLRISSARLKAKNAWLEGVVAERTKEIQHKNVVLQHQKQEIEDSINYAQRIQQAILPLQEEMKQWIPDSFVLFRPKDIVSGDFYWFQEKNRKLVFVCADCTGHGVPGAFMSMLGTNGLNNIVMERNITDPGEILANLNRLIKKSLKQDGHRGSTKDGMDAAICTIDLDKNTLYYAGANRPLWVIDDLDVREVKATKVAVAGFTPEDQIFETHEIPLSKKLKFYMTSDGYADQFGGDREKKYKVKNMKEFILQHCKEPFDKQRDLLEAELIAWMGGIEQIDDVCVVGFEA